MAKYSKYKYKSDPNKKTVVESLAERLIARLDEMEKSKWEKGFSPSPSKGWPQNISGRKYNLRTALFINDDIAQYGYKTPVFMTWNQINEEGKTNPNFKLRKGTKASYVFQNWKVYVPKDDPFGKYIYDKDYDALSPVEKENYKERWLQKTIPVFNIDSTTMEEVQPERYKAILAKFSKLAELPDRTGMYENPVVDRMIANQEWYVPIKEDRDIECAFYRHSFDWEPEKDVIKVPMKGQYKIHDTPEEIYKDGQEWYSTLFHEMAHSTGAPSRLNRKTIVERTPENYAKEELIAELTAATIGSLLGMDKRIEKNNIAYLQGWKSALSEEKSNHFLANTALPAVDRAARMIIDKYDEISIKMGREPLNPELAAKPEVQAEIEKNCANQTEYVEAGKSQKETGGQAEKDRISPSDNGERAAKDLPQAAKVENIQRMDESAEELGAKYNRLKADCNYFLGAAGGEEACLAKGSVKETTKAMSEIASRLPDAERRLEEVKDYEKRMESLRKLHDALDNFYLKFAADVSELQPWVKRYTLPEPVEAAGHRYTTVSRSLVGYTLHNDREKLNPINITEVPVEGRDSLTASLEGKKELPLQNNNEYFQKVGTFTNPAILLSVVPPSVAKEARYSLFGDFENMVKDGHIPDERTVMAKYALSPGDLSKVSYGSPLKDKDDAAFRYFGKDMAITGTPGKEYSLYRILSGRKVIHMALKDDSTGPLSRDVDMLLNKHDYNSIYQGEGKTGPVPHALYNFTLQVAHNIGSDFTSLTDAEAMRSQYPEVEWPVLEPRGRRKENLAVDGFRVKDHNVIIYGTDLKGLPHEVPIDTLTSHERKEILEATQEINTEIKLSKTGISMKDIKFLVDTLNTGVLNPYQYKRNNKGITFPAGGKDYYIDYPKSFSNTTNHTIQVKSHSDKDWKKVEIPAVVMEKLTDAIYEQNMKQDTLDAAAKEGRNAARRRERELFSTVLSKKGPAIDKMDAAAIFDDAMNDVLSGIDAEELYDKVIGLKEAGHKNSELSLDDWQAAVYLNAYMDKVELDGVHFENYYMQEKQNASVINAMALTFDMNTNGKIEDVGESPAEVKIPKETAGRWHGHSHGVSDGQTEYTGAPTPLVEEDSSKEEAETQEESASLSDQNEVSKENEQEESQEHSRGLHL